MSEVKVNKISPRSGTTVTLGDSGDTFAITSGASISGFTSTGIDDNADATAITINSSEQVGIGTTSPSNVLHIKNSNPTIRLEDSDASSSIYGQIISNGAGDINLSADVGNAGSSTKMTFSTDGSEAMRIDSSGNLLVGQTTNGITGLGIGLVPNGVSHFYTVGERALELGRGTSDGEILRFNRSGTTVGNIGANSSSLYIAGTSKGFRFTASQLKPCNTSGANDDGNYDLGSSSTRFKDLYLGGGLYVGGTGTANKLDDYEEGTWTPGVNQGTINNVGSTYIKIGNKVTIWSSINSFSNRTSTETVEVSSLPFSIASQNQNRVVGSIVMNYSNKLVHAAYTRNASEIAFYISTAGAFVPLKFNDLNNSASNIIFTATYEV